MRGQFDWATVMVEQLPCIARRQYETRRIQ